MSELESIAFLHALLHDKPGSSNSSTCGTLNRAIYELHRHSPSRAL